MYPSQVLYSNVDYLLTIRNILGYIPKCGSSGREKERGRLKIPHKSHTLNRPTNTDGLLSFASQHYCVLYLISSSTMLVTHSLISTYLCSRKFQRTWGHAYTNCVPPREDASQHIIHTMWSSPNTGVTQQIICKFRVSKSSYCTALIIQGLSCMYLLLVLYFTVFNHRHSIYNGEWMYISLINK